MKILEAIDQIKDIAPVMIGASVAGGLLGVYNPAHAVFGSVGQILFLMGSYVLRVNQGKQSLSYPKPYWFIVIFMGAILSFIVTPQLTRYIPFEQYLLAFLIGSLAQNFVDMLNKLYKKFSKDNGLEE